jgi:hypothetical protein
MRIADITMEDIRHGRNWRACCEDFDFFEQPLEELEIEDCVEFTTDDTIVYSGIWVGGDDSVVALVLIKEAFDAGYGGDYCEYVNGRWKQLGLVANPNAQPGNEYIANPLDLDPSFDAPDHDYREYHRTKFLAYKDSLND